MVLSTTKMTAEQFLQLGEDPPGIRLELVDDVETKEQQREKRKPQKGYVVEQAGGAGYVSPMDVLKIQAPSSL